MLSGETAVGEFPVEAVAYMDRIARAVEPSLDYRHEMPEATRARRSAGDVERACDLAEALQAKAILVPTFTGRTANAVARLRRAGPIVALTHVDWAMRQLALEWGVTPVASSRDGDVEELWRLRVERAREAGIVESGDRVVITAGTAVNIPARRTSSRSTSSSSRRTAAPAGELGLDGCEEETAHGAHRWTGRRRWFALGALVLVGLLYYRPLHDYFDARSQQAAQLTTVREAGEEASCAREASAARIVGCRSRGGGADARLRAPG
jgi:hypothetical protein